MRSLLLSLIVLGTLLIGGTAAQAQCHTGFGGGHRFGAGFGYGGFGVGYGGFGYGGFGYGGFGYGGFGYGGFGYGRLAVPYVPQVGFAVVAPCYAPAVVAVAAPVAVEFPVAVAVPVYAASPCVGAGYCGSAFGIGAGYGNFGAFRFGYGVGRRHR